MITAPLLLVAVALAQQPRPRPAPAPLPRLAAIRVGTAPELVIMNEDGSRPRRVEISLVHSRPAWSPGGRRLAFAAEIELSFLEIFVLEADGAFAQITSSGPHSAFAPSWSPDGRRIAYTEERDGQTDVWVIDSYGREPPVQLTRDRTNEGQAAWSPDGATIAFVSNRRGNDDIYLMNADGSNARLLIGTPAAESAPVFSPDGSRIAWVSDAGGNQDIYVAAADGRSPVRLTDATANDASPSWSPDGRHIMFTRLAGEDAGAIHIAAADGAGERRLPLSGQFSAVAWGSVPSAVAETLPPPREGELRLPAGSSGPVPVVVFLPYTTGTASELIANYLGDTPDGFASILLAGRGSAHDYSTGPNWAATIARYERQLFADLARFAARGLDTTRVVLAGFSLGGDLAWALALRNPSRITGAVVMGSRASYRARAADHQALAANGRRFFLSLGAGEQPARTAGAQAAAALLAQLGVEHRMIESGAGHAPAAAPAFSEGLRFVLGSRP